MRINTEIFKTRILIMSTYSLGFMLGIIARSWWALPVSLVVSFICSFIFFAGKSLLKTYGIGWKNQPMTRQQRRALAKRDEFNRKIYGK